MSKCPFWSTDSKKEDCYELCPMNNFFEIKDNCPFKEYLSHSKISYKGIDDYDFVKDENKEIKLDFMQN